MIHEERNKFEEALAEDAQVLSKSQKQLSQEVYSHVDDFRRAVEEHKKHFQENAPYSSSDKVENSAAKELIHESKLLTKDMRDREDEVRTRYLQN